MKKRCRVASMRENCFYCGKKISHKEKMEKEEMDKWNPYNPDHYCCERCRGSKKVIAYWKAQGCNIEAGGAHNDMVVLWNDGRGKRLVCRTCGSYTY